MSKGVGMKTSYKMGDWYALCDRCQKKFYASQLKKEWTGWRVCKSCFDPKHPQESLKGKKDNENVPWTRPDSNANTNVTTVDGNTLISDNYYDTVSDADKTLTVGTHNPVQEWDIDLTADRTITLDTTGAQEMDRWTISRKGGGAFNLIIGSVKTTAIPSITVVEYRNSAWYLESYTPLGT